MNSVSRVIAILLLLASVACVNNGFEYSELSFTRNKPNETDLVGKWVPTKKTLQGMERRGHYKISTHFLTLESNGTFKVVNMPDWWLNSFGLSQGGYDNLVGTWRLAEGKDIWRIWVIDLSFVLPSREAIEANRFRPSGPIDAVLINVQRQKPPYLLHLVIGDPDSGNYMLFEKEQ